MDQAPLMQVARAVLTARGVATTYARVGTGAPVLLLRVAEGDDVSSALVATLAARFRVLAPARPAAIDARATDAVVGWLRDLLDGLGVERVSIVAERELGPAALALVVGDPLRVERLALLPGPGASPEMASIGVVENGAGAVGFLTGETPAGD